MRSISLFLLLLSIINNDNYINWVPSIPNKTFGLIRIEQKLRTNTFFNGKRDTECPHSIHTNRLYARTSYTTRTLFTNDKENEKYFSQK